MSGWSDIALRARATTVIPSAVMYKAHAVLTRGRSTVAPGHIWVDGQNKGVLRYVDSPAHSAHAAHLVAGWEQDQQAAASMLLGSYDLPAYMGHRPYFWTGAAPAGYEHMPNSVAGVPAIAFWRDVCASLCFRWHDDDVEMMQVDLRPGLHQGHETHVRSSKCDCYAYDDLAKLNRTDAEPEVSHEAPNDVAMARFLSTAKLVNNYVGTGPHDSFRYRQFINTYAVHRDPWESYFVVEEQSSVFHRLALEPSYYVDTDTLAAYATKARIPDLNACMRECAQDYDHRMNLAAVVFRDDFANIGYANCWCTTKDLLHPDHDANIRHNPGRTDITVHRAKLCVGVSGGSERSVVYRKGVKGANAVCHGMPVGSGMILANGSVFLSKDASDDTRPIDVQCRSACDANPDCALAHSFVSAPLKHFTQYTLAYTHQTCTPTRLECGTLTHPCHRYCCTGRDLQRAADG